MKAVIIAISVLFALCGCVAITGGYDYDIISYNETDQCISDFSAREGPYEYGAGVLAPDAPASYHGGKISPPNSRFDLSWTDSAGVGHSTTVKPKVWLTFQGELVFIVESSDTVRLEVYQEKHDFYRQVLIPRSSQKNKQPNQPPLPTPGKCPPSNHDQLPGAADL